MKNIFILGRGKIASRLEQFILSRTKFSVIDNYQNADFIFLADNDTKVSKWIRDNNLDYETKLYYDFSGFTKKNGLGKLAIPQMLGWDKLSHNGVVALPACYASSIILPVLYLMQQYNMKIKGICATLLGGKSTLGESKVISKRTGRLSSQKSCLYHIKEICRHTNIKEENILMSIMVADLNDGILTKFVIDYEKLPINYSDEIISFTENGWIKEHLKQITWSNNEYEICNFSIKKTGNKIEVTSFVHNLNLPIEIAFIHMNKVFRGEHSWILN